MIKMIQGELFRIRKNRLFKICLIVFALEHIVHQLVQGYSMEVGRVTHAAHLPVKFLQISFRGIAFFVWVWYSELGILRD